MHNGMKYGYIYKVSYNGLNYYGSSNDKERFYKHKNSYKRWRDGKHHFESVFILFKKAEEMGEIPIFEIITCFITQLCREEQRKIEQIFIDNNECININNAYTDRREYLKQYYQQKKLLNQVKPIID